MNASKMSDGHLNLPPSSGMLGALEAAGASVNGDIDHSAPHILNLRVGGIDGEALVVGLSDAFGFATGSACTSSDYSPSHVLSAMGLDSRSGAGIYPTLLVGRPDVDLRAFQTAVETVGGACRWRSPRLCTTIPTAM